jgi:hypothetical protein
MTGQVDKLVVRRDPSDGLCELEINGTPAGSHASLTELLASLPEPRTGRPVT